MALRALREIEAETLPFSQHAPRSTHLQGSPARLVRAADPSCVARPLPRREIPRPDCRRARAHRAPAWRSRIRIPQRVLKRRLPIGHRHCPALFVDSSLIVQPSGNDQRQNARAIDLAQKIGQRRDQEFGDLGRTLRADARYLVANRRIRESPHHSGCVVIQSMPASFGTVCLTSSM